MTIAERLNKRTRITVENFKNDCRFSKRLAYYRFINDIGGRIGLTIIAQRARQKKERYILQYLENKLKDVIDSYKQNNNSNNKGINTQEAPIWTCWWTGIQSAPLLVQQCIKSIKNNCSSHPLNVISEDNYKEYIEIPQFILEKTKQKQILPAHLADYIRVSLLNKYGGLWLDATIFCKERIPESYFEMPIFTCKSEPIYGKYLSDYQWTTFCLGGYKQNILFSFLEEAFELYWSQEDKAIDYLFFDDLIYIAKENIQSVKQFLEDVPINNTHRDELQAVMNQNISCNDINDFLYGDTILYKLSWREGYQKTTSNGKMSVYGYFLNMPL